MRKARNRRYAGPAARQKTYFLLPLPYPPEDMLYLYYNIFKEAQSL